MIRLKWQKRGGIRFVRIGRVYLSFGVSKPLAKGNETMGKTWRRDDAAERGETFRNHRERDLMRSHKAQEQVAHLNRDDDMPRNRKAIRRLARLGAVLIMVACAHQAFAWGSHSGGTGSHTSGWKHTGTGSSGSSMSGYMHGKG
jgi:hypothetical protein